jgi:sensor domain CHASE-containing protein
MSNKFAQLPLQRKVSLTLLLTITAFALISYAILSGVITPAFENLELSAAKTDLVRAERAIDAELANLSAVTADWAPWDDIYEYVSGRSPGFEKSNLVRPTLANLGLDLMAVYAVDSELMWSQLLVEGEEHDIAELGIFGPEDAAFRILAQHAGESDQTLGIVKTALGPMLISSQPILQSDYTGPIAGAVVIAQFMNKPRLARLRERTEVDIEWFYVENSGRHFPEIDGSTISEGTIKIDATELAISSYTPLYDIFGEPLLVLGADTPRDITSLGERTVKAAMLFLLSAGVLVAIVVWFLLRKTILAPIESLTSHMNKIRKSGDLSSNLNMDSGDEVGSLAGQFDILTSEVHEARKALLAQSFKAGKADTAAEVLHNIRNAMTPMINGIDRLKKAFRAADDLRIGEATEQLMDPKCEPDRAAKFSAYINASFEHVKSVNADASDDMDIVMSQARQIKAILTDQEKFANVAPVAENIVIDEVIGEATNVIPKDSGSNISVDLDDELNQYRVLAHRTGLLQILGNLILNAYESIERGQRSDGRISLSAVDAVIDDKAMVRLTVRDNGTGFSEEICNRIFRRGFTSKREGDTSGLGLHWCANAVSSMGGRISAESPGTGQGAEFHVLLPAAQGG